MIINQKFLKDGVTPGLLEQLIQKHEMQRSRILELKQYYLGNHHILGRKKESGGANNKIISNHAKYITDMSVAYFLGAPVTYSASNGFDIEDMKNTFFEQDIASVDYKLAKEASICGRAVERIYANDNSEPRSCMLSSESAFVVYDDTVEKKKILGVHYYREIRPDGTEGDDIVFCADAEKIQRYRGNGSGSGLRLEEENPHYFGDVPFVEFCNNDELQGDFEQEISLIDAYNTLMSDRVNDKEQFVDAFLLLLGIDIDGEQAKKLKEEKILCGEIGGSGEYLSKNLNEADTEVLRTAIKDDIHKMSMTPDLTDEQFAGNLSGIAIKYKLLGFEQNIRNKESLFKKALGERISLYMNFLNIKRNTPIVPLHRVDIEFHRNLPANELEISQMITNLSGTVSDETLLSRLPFVTDAKEERKILLREQAKKQQNMLAQMGDYNEPIKTGDEVEE